MASIDAPASPATADQPPRARIAWREVLIVAGVWTLVGTLAALQNGLSRVYEGRPVHWGLLLASFLVHAAGLRRSSRRLGI